MKSVVKNFLMLFPCGNEFGIPVSQPKNLFNCVHSRIEELIPKHRFRLFILDPKRLNSLCVILRISQNTNNRLFWFAERLRASTLRHGHCLYDAKTDTES